MILYGGEFPGRVLHFYPNLFSITTVHFLNGVTSYILFKIWHTVSPILNITIVEIDAEWFWYELDIVYFFFSFLSHVFNLLYLLSSSIWPWGKRNSTITRTILTVFKILGTWNCSHFSRDMKANPPPQNN